MLDALRVRSVVYCRSELGAPWGFRVGASRPAKFHLVLSGTAILALDTGDEVALEAGDVVLLPRGSGHVMRDRPTSRVRRPSGPQTRKSAPKERSSWDWSPRARRRIFPVRPKNTWESGILSSHTAEGTRFTISNSSNSLRSERARCLFGNAWRMIVPRRAQRETESPERPFLWPQRNPGTMLALVWISELKVSAPLLCPVVARLWLLGLTN